MSMYTTGEMAKLCGVTVRTVQYYDTRNILVPSELSEGGRRLYSQEDLTKLKVICFLRSMDISINSIASIFEEDDPKEVIMLLAEQKEIELKNKIEKGQDKLTDIVQLKKEIKSVNNFSVESIADIAHKMADRKRLNKLRMKILIPGIIYEFVEAAALLLWILKGIWWPLLASVCLGIALGVGITPYVYKRTAYICPHCHEDFRPKFREWFFAKHTYSVRKLTCLNCGHKGYCVEIYKENTK